MPPSHGLGEKLSARQGSNPCYMVTGSMSDPVLVSRVPLYPREDLGPFSRGSADFWRGGEKFFLPTFCYAFKRYKL